MSRRDVNILILARLGLKDFTRRDLDLREKY